MFEDFASSYETPRAKGPGDQEAKSFEWIAEFLLWLRDDLEGWRVLPGVALQALCALRVNEMLRLRWDHVDLVAEIIRIDGELKNDSSRRVLPLPRLVLEILSEAPKSGERVVDSYRTESGWLVALRGKRWQRKRDGSLKVTPGFLDRFEPGSYIPPKNLRNTLSTEGVDRLWSDPALDDYYGLSASGTRRRHYTIRDLEQRIPILRREVTEKVDDLFAGSLDRWLEPVADVIPLRRKTGSTDTTVINPGFS